MNLSDEIPLLSSFYPLRYDTGSKIATILLKHLLGPPQVSDQMGGGGNGFSYPPQTGVCEIYWGGHWGGNFPPPPFWWGGEVPPLGWGESAAGENFEISCYHYGGEVQKIEYFR